MIARELAAFMAEQSLHLAAASVDSVMVRQRHGGAGRRVNANRLSAGSLIGHDRDDV
jgi:hypothetical protein